MTDVTALDPPTEAGDRLDRRAPNGWTVVTAWLADHTKAMVGALTAQGLPTAMPAAIPLGPGHRVEDRSLLDLVIGDDTGAVTEGFLDALHHGAAVRWVRLASEPERAYLLQYVDTREGATSRSVGPGGHLG